MLQKIPNEPQEPLPFDLYQFFFESDTAEDEQEPEEEIEADD